MDLPPGEEGTPPRGGRNSPQGRKLRMDVCFWTPVPKATLEQMRTKLEQADYLMKHFK